MPSIIIVIIIVIAILIRRRGKRQKKKAEFFKQELKDNDSKQTSGVQEDEIEKSATIKAQHLKEYEEYKKRLEKTSHK